MNSGTEIASKSDSSLAFILRGVLCVLILAAGGGAFALFASLKQKPKEKPKEELLKTLIGAKLRSEIIQTEISGYGTARACRIVEVSSEIKGMISQCNGRLSEGMGVKKGELLATIDDRDYQNSLKEAEAELSQLQASLAITKQNIANGKLIQETLRANLELEKKDLERSKSLHAKGAKSMAHFEQVQQAVEDKKNLVLVQKGRLAVNILEKDSIAAKIRKAEAIKQQVELNIKRCQILSPCDGRLEKVHIYEGEYVSPGTLLLAIADDSHLEIPVSLNASEAAKILNLKNTGDHWFSIPQKTQVIIEWAESPEKCNCKGKVARVENFDSQTRTVTVIVDTISTDKSKNGDMPLVAGMFCRVTLQGKKLPNAFKIPWSSVQLDKNVFIVGADGIVNEREIEIFYSDDDQVVVSKGLKTGETLVTQRVPRGIVNGSKVKIANPD